MTDFWSQVRGCGSSRTGTVVQTQSTRPHTKTQTRRWIETTKTNAKTHTHTHKTECRQRHTYAHSYNSTIRGTSPIWNSYVQYTPTHTQVNKLSNTQKGRNQHLSTFHHLLQRFFHLSHGQGWNEWRWNNTAQSYMYNVSPSHQHRSL